MFDIVHRIGMTKPLEEVYRALATPEGLAAWWTTDTSGRSEVGEKLSFRFGDIGGFDMEVLELDPAGRVRWSVVDGPPEWIGTEVDWQLDQRDEWTIVQFAQRGWREQVEFMGHCSTKWAVYLLSLKELVETGRGRPTPDDIQISDWH